MDKFDGERDDFWFMFAGLLVVAVTPIGFMMSSYPWQIYIIQIIRAIGVAMTMPAWLAIFTRHIDKGKEAFEWSLETTSISAGAGIAGGLGGIIAALIGFNFLFIFVSSLTFISAFLLLIAKNDLFKRRDSSKLIAEKPVVEP